MTIISQMTFSNAFSRMKICILIQISLKFVSEGPINNNSVLVPVMALRQTGDNYAIIWTDADQFTDAYIWAPGEMS